MYQVRDCRSCHWYDPAEGYCAMQETYVHGHDGWGCDDFQPVRKRRANDEGVDWAAFLRGREERENDY